MITTPNGSQQFCSCATPGLAGFREKSASSCCRWVALHRQFSAIAQAAPGKPRGMAKRHDIADAATITVAQNIGQDSLEGFATHISTGVTSGPTQLFASALLKTYRCRTGQGT